MDGQLRVVPGAPVTIDTTPEEIPASPRAPRYPRFHNEHFPAGSLSIRVMTTLLMVALLIFGGIAYTSLPVSELPNVDFSHHPGLCLAGRRGIPRPSPQPSPRPLENALSMIPGIDSMTSSSVQGSATITIQFAARLPQHRRGRHRRSGPQYPAR